MGKPAHRQQRPVPPASPSGRSNAALGEPARRHHGPRHARIRSGAVPGSGSDGDASARRSYDGRKRWVSGGLVFARRAQHSHGLRHHRHLVPVLPREIGAVWGGDWQPGSATFVYANDQRATTLWYHDHTLGMTRVNVYAGPAGFYLIRGGSGDPESGVLRKYDRGERPDVAVSGSRAAALSLPLPKRLRL